LQPLDFDLAGIVPQGRYEATLIKRHYGQAGTKQAAATVLALSF